MKIEVFLFLGVVLSIFLLVFSFIDTFKYLFLRDKVFFKLPEINGKEDLSRKINTEQVKLKMKIQGLEEKFDYLYKELKKIAVEMVGEGMDVEHKNIMSFGSLESEKRMSSIAFIKRKRYLLEKAIAEENVKVAEKSIEKVGAGYKETIDAEMAGTFYRAAAADKPPFVEEGTKVNEGDSLFILEAMKLFNEIGAPIKCKIVKILVENGEMVKKNQPIMAIEKL